MSRDDEMVVLKDIVAQLSIPKGRHDEQLVLHQDMGDMLNDLTKCQVQGVWPSAYNEGVCRMYCLKSLIVIKVH